MVSKLKVRHSWLQALFLLVLTIPGLAIAGATPHYLYKIDFNGHSSYLLGTMHQKMAVERFDGLEEAILSTESVYTERVDFLDHDLETLLAEAKKRGLLAVKELEDSSRFGPRSAAKIEAFLETLSDDNRTESESILKSAPVGLAYHYLIYLALAPKDPKKSPPEAVIPSPERESIFDFSIVRKAKELGKGTYALDTTAGNLEFYLQEANAVHLNNLVHNEIADSGSRTHSLAYTGYLTPEERVLYEMAIHTYEQGSLDKEMAKVGHYDLLAERDRLWQRQLIEAMSDAPNFVAVGAAHVLRDGGLLDYFSSQGAKIERRPQISGVQAVKCRKSAIKRELL